MSEQERLERRRELKRHWRNRNKDKIREQGRRQYAANREKRREYFRQYRAKNYSKVIAQERVRRAEQKKRHPDYSKEWRKNNREKCREYSRRYRAQNAERIRILERERRDKNREQIYERQRQWRKNNPEKMSARWKKSRQRPGAKEVRQKWYYQQRATNPRFVITTSLRCRFYDLIRRGHAVKTAGMLQLIGCKVDELRHHLETQFKKEMTWANYGKVWHIDHIVPCSHFDLTDPRQQCICFNYLNLRPCFAKDNIRRGNRLEHPAQLPLGI